MRLAVVNTITNLGPGDVYITDASSAAKDLPASSVSMMKQMRLAVGPGGSLVFVGDANYPSVVQLVNHNVSATVENCK